LDPVAVVQRQLDAYNARDLPRFLAEYSENVRVYRLPSAEPHSSARARSASSTRRNASTMPACTPK